MDVNSSTEAIYENTEELAKGSNRRCSSFRLLLVSVGILSVLLLVSIGIICWAGWKMSQQDEAVADLRNLTKHLKTENEKLQEETEKLSKQKNDLNQTIQLIQKFNIYPVDEHCDSGKCLLCQKGWLFFDESCYFFSDVLLIWNNSRVFCQYSFADLVVIDNLEEMRFIYNGMNTNKGYWLGLSKVGSDWVWINDHIDTLRFWRSSYPRSTDSYAFMYRSGNPTASWASTLTYGANPLCEQKAFNVSLN